MQYKASGPLEITYYKKGLLNIFITRPIKEHFTYAFIAVLQTAISELGKKVHRQKLMNVSLYLAHHDS